MNIGRNKGLLAFFGIVFLVVFLISLFSLIKISRNNALASKKDGSRPMFYTDAGTTSDFKVGNQASSSLEGTIASSKFEVNLSLQNNYDSASICTYDFFFEWADNAEGYYHTKNTNNELTMTGIIDNITLFKDTAIDDFNLANKRTFLASYYIINEGNGLSALSLDATLKLNKKNVNQSAHDGKNYPGMIVIDNVRCAEATKLIDKDLSINNYVCLSHDKSPFCAEENLYQVIDKDSTGIKIVRPLEYGTAVWSDNFFDNNFDNYVATYLNEFQNAILEETWPITNYSSLNINYEKALKEEKNAELKVKSKVGVLTLSDILKHEFLKDYKPPYLVSVKGGALYTTSGITLGGKTIGLVYPVIKLKAEVVTSRGNGTIASPYYIN